MRRWAECAADYPEDVQREYAGILSFDHFKVAKRLSATLSHPPVYFLDWCMNRDGHIGTVPELLRNFLPEQQGAEEATVWWAGVKSKAAAVFEQWPDQEERTALISFMEEISEIVLDRTEE